LKGALNAILIFRNALLAEVDTIYTQVEIFKYVAHVEIKICLVLAINVRQWDAHNVKMEISN
jgi:hypothetical protein